MMQKEDDWSPNPFWDTLFIILKSADLKFFLFAGHLPASLLNQWESVSDLKEICTQSCGHIKAFRHIISLKTSLQQPCSWIHNWDLKHFHCCHHFTWVFYVWCRCSSCHVRLMVTMFSGLRLSPHWATVRTWNVRPGLEQRPGLRLAWEEGGYKVPSANYNIHPRTSPI